MRRGTRPPSNSIGWVSKEPLRLMANLMMFANTGPSAGAGQWTPIPKPWRLPRNPVPSPAHSSWRLHPGPSYCVLGLHLVARCSWKVRASTRSLPPSIPSRGELRLPGKFLIYVLLALHFGSRYYYGGETRKATNHQSHNSDQTFKEPLRIRPNQGTHRSRNPRIGSLFSSAFSLGPPMPHVENR